MGQGNCRVIEGLKNLLPGWGCCKCQTYNGLQRDRCKRCGHLCCITKPNPQDYGLCELCGVPEGVPHVGHKV